LLAAASCCRCCDCCVGLRACSTTDRAADVFPGVPLSLPADIVQLYVDYLCWQQNPRLGSVLAKLALDVGTAHALHRVALRSMDARSTPSLLAWRVDDAFITPLRSLCALETLELGVCAKSSSDCCRRPLIPKPSSTQPDAAVPRRIVSQARAIR
jgi:hypothetical protein